MKLTAPAARPLLPIPLSVLLTLLWVGLVRLLFLWVAAQARVGSDGEAWAAVLFGERVLGRARLPTIIVAVSFLLLIYLWLDYRSRPAGGWRTAVFLLAAIAWPVLMRPLGRSGVQQAGQDVRRALSEARQSDEAS